MLYKYGLKDGNFAILLLNQFNGEKSILDITRKISLRKQAHFNRLNLENKTSYILYEPEKTYLFNMASNKKLKLIWKAKRDFYIIDFSNNTKGDILNYLSFDKVSEEKIEGTIEYPNVKKKFQNVKKIPLFCSGILDEAEPLLYEHLCFFIEK